MQKAVCQLRLSWSDDPKTTMSITWQSREPLSNPAVQYGEGNALSQTAPAERIRYPQETGPVYTATLRGLKPNTQYVYRAGDAGRVWSEVHTFRTAPVSTDEFTFTAFADTGVNWWARENVRRVL